jgi:hypothetical protein
MVSDYDEEYEEDFDDNPISPPELKRKQTKEAVETDKKIENLLRTATAD